MYSSYLDVDEIVRSEMVEVPKPQIVQAVKEKTQRTLKLDGDIRLAFWPGLGARVGKASLSERASDREFAAVEDVHVSLKLLPLLSRRAVADTIRIRGLRANIVKTKDGKTNVDDLAGAPPAKGTPAGKDRDRDAGGDFGFDVAGIEIIDAAISYSDQAAGAKYSLSKVNLKTGRIAPGVPTRVELSFHARGDAPKLDLRMLDHWDNPNGSIERGYAGRSLWKWSQLPDTLDPRYTDYARANASQILDRHFKRNVIVPNGLPRREQVKLHPA